MFCSHGYLIETGASHDNTLIALHDLVQCKSAYIGYHAVVATDVLEGAVDLKAGRE